MRGTNPGAQPGGFSNWPMNDLPQPVAELVNVLAAMPGAVAVVLGGFAGARVER